MSKGNPKQKFIPAGKTVKHDAEPDSYLKMTPVWRFSDFDWDGPWGSDSCAEHIQSIKTHIQLHLASFETMTWAEILKATGGRSHGNNSHPISRDKFKKEARDRLEEKSINSDSLFSLRLNNGTRVYGVREVNCLRIVFFDPYHIDRNRCAYKFTD